MVLEEGWNLCSGSTKEQSLILLFPRESWVCWHKFLIFPWNITKGWTLRNKINGITSKSYSSHTFQLHWDYEEYPVIWILLLMILTLKCTNSQILQIMYLVLTWPNPADLLLTQWILVESEAFFVSLNYKISCTTLRWAIITINNTCLVILVHLVIILFILSFPFISVVAG